MVMPIAVVVLMITLALGAAAVVAAVSSNDLSQRDSNGKAALEAAEAGLRAATYRLNMFLPASGRCPTNPSTTVGGSGLCAQDGPETLGNGSTFSYWVSDVLVPGQQCAGVPVTVPNSNLNPQYVAQRCITAVGTANTGGSNAVSARVQARVASYAAQALFSVPGLIGLNELTITNNAMINASGGTNGVRHDPQQRQRVGARPRPEREQVGVEQRHPRARHPAVRRPGTDRPAAALVRQHGDGEQRLPDRRPQLHHRQLHELRGPDRSTRAAA